MIQKIQMKEVGPTLKALRKMDKDFKVAAKDQAVKISETEAQRIKSAAHTRQQRLGMSSSVLSLAAPNTPSSLPTKEGRATSSGPPSGVTLTGLLTCGPWP